MFLAFHLFTFTCKYCFENFRKKNSFWRKRKRKTSVFVVRRSEKSAKIETFQPKTIGFANFS